MGVQRSCLFAHLGLSDQVSGWAQAGAWGMPCAPIAYVRGQCRRAVFFVRGPGDGGGMRCWRCWHGPLFGVFGAAALAASIFSKSCIVCGKSHVAPVKGKPVPSLQACGGSESCPGVFVTPSYSCAVLCCALLCLTNRHWDEATYWCVVTVCVCMCALVVFVEAIGFGWVANGGS